MLPESQCTVHSAAPSSCTYTIICAAIQQAHVQALLLVSLQQDDPVNNPLQQAAIKPQPVFNADAGQPASLCVRAHQLAQSTNQCTGQAHQVQKPQLGWVHDRTMQDEHGVCRHS